MDFVPRGSGNYTYYIDGSLKSDENEGITLILYDTYLKQPKEIQLTGARKINYYYDGAGALLKTVYSTGEYWEYTGIIYKNGQPYQMPIPEGRAVYASGAWQNEFFYTDHLGNTRVAYKANDTALTKTSETAFDPWGVVLKDAGLVNAFQNKFEYQNKEKESTFNLRRISFGARTYNASIGRFDGVDPLAEISKGFSPFVYVNNNPLRFIDPNGMASEDYTYSDGYSTLSAKNSTGSVGFSGTYSNTSNNSSTEGDPPGLWQRLIDYFGFFKKPQSKEEARTYADRQESLHELNEKSEEAAQKLLDYTDPIPVIGPLAKVSDGMMKKDAVKVAAGGLFIVLDVTGGAAGKVKQALPALDATGKVHGVLPKIKDLAKYSADELSVLLQELKQSVQKRIEVTSKLGRDKAHGQRQGAEQDLIKSIEKHLSK